MCLQRSQYIRSNKLSYTAKNMLSFFNITKETLRYYEKEGLLNPVVGENKYRYYSDWDVFLLAEFRRLRALDYSIKDIKQISAISSQKDLIDFLNNKQSYYLSRERFYKALATHNQLKLTYASEPLNHLVSTRFPETYFCSAYKSLKSFGDDEKYTNFSNMDNNDFSLCDFMLTGSIADPSLMVGGTSFLKSLLPTESDLLRMKLIPEQVAYSINLAVSDGFSLGKKNIAMIPVNLREKTFYAIQLGKVKNSRLIKLWIIK